jgi:uncharacterized protein YbjT (DUF2867 family)
MEPLTVAVTGATGYIGGRLVPRLLAEGHRVRALTRDPGRLRDVPWGAQVDIVRADALAAGSLRDALAGVDVAYYLIHSIDTGGDFETSDRLAAQNFATAAREAGVGRIVYLGGLTPRARSCRRTCARGTRSGRSCSTAACRPRFCRPPSSSAADRRRSRCCAT